MTPSSTPFRLPPDMKKALIGLVILLALLFVTYIILSGITRVSIDKTVTLAPPSSTKSQPEYYDFGFQPELRYTESRANCRQQFPEKRAFWGDLHIHTALSADAFPDGTRTYPEDVYRFAQGEVLQIPGRSGNPMTIQLERPLDFAAVTDHAETFGEGFICRTAGAYPGYDSKICQDFRAGGEVGVRALMSQNSKVAPKRKPKVCGEDGSDCLKAEKTVWNRVISAAEAAYDRSSECAFTTFIGYEYTRAPNAQHMHRNSIFRNAEVPERPASHISHPLTYQLLQSLEEECRDGIKNCDVISIPHNSNISGGNSFNPKDMDGFSVQTQMAYRKFRNAYDRLMEIVQHKGISECLNGSSDILGAVDELCDVENIRAYGRAEKAVETTKLVLSLSASDSPECNDRHLDPKDNIYKGFCLSSRDFARGALLEGMTQEAQASTNPYEFGFIGSTDTHISAAGYAPEDSWQGHIAYETDLEGRLGEPGLGRHNRIVSNPGGLAGVYAIENSRDAIFQSMKRREAFATSGPRIEPRFFAGHYNNNLCTQADWLQKAYENGTPMGSKIPAQHSPFQLLIQATPDPLSNPIDKLQLIKGWLGPDGLKHNKVIDLSFKSEDAELCQIYTDPDYDPNAPTYYYMRAVEKERPRWSTAQCDALPLDQRPENCDNDQADAIVEMAWSSPIWLTPKLEQDLPADLEKEIQDTPAHQH